MKSISPKLVPYSKIQLDLQNTNDSYRLLKKILLSDIYLSPTKIDKPVVLYGAGNLGKMAKKFFEYFNIEYLYFIDKKKKKIETQAFWSNTKILLPEEIDESDKDEYLVIICIVKTPLISLKEDLKAQGWKKIAFFYDVCETFKERYPISNGWFFSKPDKSKLNEIKKIFFELDEVSSKHYLLFLAWRRLRIELSMKDFKIENQRYFIPIIRKTLNNSEVFLDCGAHNGSTSKQFIKITKGKYRKIYLIEADNSNHEKLKREFTNFPNIVISICAVGDKETMENFCKGFDYASKIDKTGKHKIEVKTIDSLRISPTFIKMHLEGGELNALIGAKSTIRKNRPILAITIYHNEYVSRKIPLFIMENFKNYQFLLRLDSWGGTGAVFYAIPKERLESY